MTSDRLQRRIDQFLDEADEAMTRLDWQTVFDRAQAVLAASPENPDGLAYLAMAQRGLASKPSQSGSGISPAITPAQAPPQPVSFANGRYEVKRFLGEGGKKKVYLARDSLLDRDVAFALIKTEGLDEVGKERITREAQAMGRLGSHPHIVSVFDLGNESGQPFIVTELMGGGDVEGLIEKAHEHRVSLSDALEIALEVCRGLEFAHSKNIVHRDLKPGNVWLTSDRIAKIGDFGLAVATDRSRLTQSGMMVGTVSYMPPEQAMGGEVTPRSDLYSLGAMLYELVTGRPPFVGQDSIAIITQHLNAQPVNASHHRDDLPAGLDNLIMRLLEKDPERRPASAQHVREALEALRAGQVPILDDTASAAGRDIEPFRRIFVGRQPELEQLQTAFEAASAYKGGLAMVVGEPGIGKSTLCEHLATFATSHGGRVLIGHCYEDGVRSYPFLPFIEALRSYVLTREPDALRSELGTGAADVARLVPELRERLRIEPRVVEDTDAERWRLLEAVTSFLRTAASAQPLLIILEDLHWADKATLDQLLHLSRVLQGSRMLLVGTYRDIEVDRMHPLSGALAELRRLGSFLRVPLRGLTVDEVQRMASSLGGSDVAKRRAQAIQRETDGNPLYVQEVYRHLSEASSQAGSTDDADQVRVGIPEGIRDMIGKRLAGLSDSTNQVLGVAAVLGREFRMEVLGKVTDASEDAVLNAMEEATERNIVEEHTLVGQGVSYRFSHAFFREVLYGEISLLRRMRLHQQAGRVLEQVYGRRLDEHAGEVAEHFAHSSESSDLRKALEYSELAARQASSRKAYQEAATHLLRALAASKAFDPDNAAKQTDLTLALGEALIASGEPLRVAQNEAIGALNLATGHNDRARARSAARLGIGATWAYGGPAAFATHLGSEWVQRVRDLATPGTAEAADVSLAVALSAMSLGDFKAAAEQLRAGLNAARQHSDSTRLATLGAVFLHLVSPETWAEAASVYDELQRVATDRLDAGTHASLLFHFAEFAFAKGDALAGQSHLRQLRDLAAVEANYPQVALLAQFAAVLTEVREGHLGDAIRLAQTTLNEARDLGNGLLGEYLETLLIVQPMLDTGRAEEADALLHDPGMSRWGIQQSALGCLTSASRGERDAAGRVLRELLTPMSDDILPFAPLRLLGHLTRVALLLSDSELAQRIAGFLATTGAACDGLSGVSFARVTGEAARLNGQPGPAKNSFENALRDVEGWRAESALVRLDLAEAVMDGAVEEREQAIAYLDAAISELREMRMRPALERALGRRELLKA